MEKPAPAVRGRFFSDFKGLFCVFLCIATHFFANERVDALFAIIIQGASLCILVQDVVLFSSWCNFFNLKMHCVQKPIPRYFLTFVVHAPPYGFWALMSKGLKVR